MRDRRWKDSTLKKIKTYLWGHPEKGLDKSPKNGIDLLAFEACIVERSAPGARSSPWLTVLVWARQCRLSSADQYLTPTPAQQHTTPH